MPPYLRRVQPRALLAKPALALEMREEFAAVDVVQDHVQLVFGLKRVPMKWSGLERSRVNRYTPKPF